MNSAFDDEITSINSIYGDQTLSPCSTELAVCTLRIPSAPSIVLRCRFPSDYPDAPPAILGIETIGSDAPRGSGVKVVTTTREILEKVYKRGEPCIFDVLEELATALEIDGNHQDYDDTESQIEVETPEEDEDLGNEPPWSISVPIIEKKSVFVGRAAPASSTIEAQQFLCHLLATDKKVAKATHNITAWRIRGTDGTSHQDCDDDGETAAGGRLLRLMQLMDIWDVVVVVTRWYGGVLLGPDRFRIINTAAREALVEGGFSRDAETSKKKSKK